MTHSEVEAQRSTPPDEIEPLQTSLYNSYASTAAVHSDMSEKKESEDPAMEMESPPPLPKDPAESLAASRSPEDSYYLVYAIFFLMGISSLVPFNFFITAKEYWAFKLSNGTDLAGHEEPRSELRDYFENYLVIAATVPSVLALIINYLLVNKLSPDQRILSSLVIMLVVFIATTVMVKIDVSGDTVGFFAGTLASVVVINGASNLFAGSVFGISARFPMRISQALISGQGMGGTLSAVASVVDLAAAKDVTDSALAFFLTADVFILLCIILYLMLPKLDYSRHYMLANCPDPGALPKGSLPQVEGGGPREPASSVPPLMPILSKTWVLGLCVFYVFNVSIMAFPAVSSGIQSVDKDSGSPLTNTYFVPLISFFLYNLSDYCGRQATAWMQVPGPTSKWLPFLVVLRSVLVPLLMFCNYQPRDHLHTVVFQHDVFPVVFICLLGISNGYLGTLLMIYGPQAVDRDLVEATGVVMTFFLTLGLATGSALSVLIVHSI